MATEAQTRLNLRSTEEGGMRRPLQTPTPSLVFRVISEGDLGPGLVGVIHTESGRPLILGESVAAKVVFPEAEANDFVRPGARFALWNLRVVGDAEISAVRGAGR